MCRVVFEAEASEGEVRQVASPPFPFPFPSPPLSIPLHPPLTPLSFPVPYPFPSPLSPTPCPPLPLPLPPFFMARGSGGALKLPQRVRAEPGRQTFSDAF